MTTTDNSWVLITGASSGFGEEFARQYAEQGHSLVLVARRLDRLQALAETLRGEGVALLLAQAHGSVRDRLRKTGAMAVIGEEYLYRSVDGAVQDFLSRQQAGEASAAPQTPDTG